LEKARKESVGIRGEKSAKSAEMRVEALRSEEGLKEESEL
jgi:hypothetical protein